jgi:MFS family permease
MTNVEEVDRQGPDRHTVQLGDLAVNTGTLRSALRHRGLRRLLLGLGASQAGDWIYNVALLGLVYGRTHSAMWVSATTLVRVLPVVVLGPIGGMLADRYNRKTLMIVCDVLRAAIMLMFVAMAVCSLPIGWAPVLAGLATAAGAPYPACAAATTVRLVPDADLSGANAARAVIGPTCIVVGPAIGAVLLALSSAGLAFAVNTVSFVVSALAVASIPGGAVFAPPTRSQRPHPFAKWPTVPPRCGRSDPQCSWSLPMSCAASSTGS